MDVPSVPRIWRERKYKYRLIGSKCKKCGRIFYPPRKVCLCGSTDMEEVELPKRGKIISYTTVYYAPREFQKYAPYVVAIVELENGTRILAQITDINPSEVHIGMHVEATLRKLREQGKEGIIEYGIKFRPIIS